MSTACRSLRDREVHQPRGRQPRHPGPAGGRACSPRSRPARTTRPAGRWTCRITSRSPTSAWRSPTPRWRRAFVNTTIILVVSVIGTIVIGTMAAYAIDRFQFRFKKLVLALFLLATLVPAVTTQVATFQVVNTLGLYNTLARADRAVHGHRHRLDLHLRAVHASRSRSRWTRRRRSTARTTSRSTGASSCRCSSPPSRPSMIIKGIAIYNEFYIPFLYMPSPGPRRHLDVPVPVQGTVRHAVGDPVGRRRHRHHPDPDRLPAAAAVHLQRPVRRAPPSDAGGTGQLHPDTGSSCMISTTLNDGWTLRAAGGPVPGRIAGRADAGAGARHRAHRPADGRPDRRPVRGPATRPSWPGCTAPTGATSASSRSPRRPTTSGSTWSSTVWTRWPPITLAGVVVGRTANQHRSYRFDVRDRCTAGRNRHHARRRTSGRALDHAEAEAGPGRRAPGRLPASAEHGPQDGVQLRLGLGPGPADRGHLAAGAAANAGAPPGWPRSARW